MPATLLVADDAPAVRDLLRDVLDAEGFAVLTAQDGTEALALAPRADLVLLDVMMPGPDGFEIVRRLRTSGGPPVILLTARVAEMDRIAGLELGADDYVTKPFSVHEVVARVRAVLRRTSTATVLRGGDVVLDADRHRVEVRGAQTDLTRSEFDLLRALMAAGGRALSRADLLDVLGADDGSERTVNVHVRNLRTKIEADPTTPTHVQTVFGVGYRFAL